jgi:hypothetical protein
MPNGFPGPTPHIPPEKAFSISVHLRRPDRIKGWGPWLEGRFHRVTEWDAGGIQIFDMEHPNRRELSSGNVAFLSAQRYRFQSALSSNARVLARDRKAFRPSTDITRIAGLLLTRPEFLIDIGRRLRERLALQPFPIALSASF